MGNDAFEKWYDILKGGDKVKVDVTLEYKSGCIFYVSEVVLRFNADHTILIISERDNSYYIPMEYIKDVSMEVC